MLPNPFENDSMISNSPGSMGKLKSVEQFRWKYSERLGEDTNETESCRISSEFLVINICHILRLHLPPSDPLGETRDYFKLFKSAGLFACCLDQSSVSVLQPSPPIITNQQNHESKPQIAALLGFSSTHVYDQRRLEMSSRLEYNS